MSKRSGETNVETGSGNVFADMGLADADDRQAKAALAICIEQCIKGRGLTREDAIVLLGITDDKLGHLESGRFLLKAFTYDDLFRCLKTLGCNISIAIEIAPPDRHGTITVECLLPYGEETPEDATED